MSDRLRPRDLGLLALETGSSPMHNATVEIFDPGDSGFDYASLVRLIGDRISFVPRYRQRLVRVPGRLANPALDDFLHRDAIKALLPPKTREATFRRARLCQFATDTDGAFLPAGVWEGLSTGLPVPDGSEVVIALDGSFSDDTTALLVASVGTEPHVDKVKVWQRPANDDSYRVPVAEVEQTIRDSCRRWKVLEIVADPFRWTRTLQILESENLPVVEFPHSPARLTAATTDLFSAATNARLTHSGDQTLAEHVAAAVIVEDARGIRLSKASRSRSARKIDLAACLVMAHSRATWRATHKKRSKTRSFAA